MDDEKKDKSDKKDKRGFASMDPDKQREIARRGGQASGRARSRL